MVQSQRQSGMPGQNMIDGKEINMWIKSTLTYAAVSGGHFFSSGEINQAIGHIASKLPKNAEGAAKPKDIAVAFLNAAKDFAEVDPTEEPDPEDVADAIAANAQDHEEPSIATQHEKVLEWMYKTVAFISMCNETNLNHEQIEHVAVTEIIQKAQGNRKGPPTREDLDYLIRATIDWGRRQLELEVV